MPLKAQRIGIQTSAKHLRITHGSGIVETADPPKGSKETRQLLSEKVVRYVDGGTQFIPVDWDAYKELREKGIPSVNCHHLETEEIGEQVRIPAHPDTRLDCRGFGSGLDTDMGRTGQHPSNCLVSF